MTLEKRAGAEPFQHTPVQPLCVTCTAKAASRPKPSAAFTCVIWQKTYTGRDIAPQGALGFGMTVWGKLLAFHCAHSSGQ